MTPFERKPGVATRRVKPSHEKWNPRGYQVRAVDFLLDHGVGALFLDPGLGKTSIVLEAFRQLQKQGRADAMLVVAPLRVCQLVWRQEAAKWTQFRKLKISLLHGSKKEERLNDDADIWLINPEGVAWLCDQHYKEKFPWDTIVIDELTRFKNPRAKRCKRLRPKIFDAERKWGLTGTPTPNGYMDLFGQMLILDNGMALGRYITHFRDRYFQKGFDGFTYTLRLGADHEIEERIKPYVLRMSAEDYLDLPPLVPDIRYIEMPKKARKAYKALKKDMLIELKEGRITATNAGAAYNKLKQMANGNVYTSDIGTDRKVAFVHEEKLEYLEELVDELAGQPLLVAYEFKHDLAAIKRRFGDIPHLGAGVTSKQAEEIERLWNSNKLPILPVHPKSAGHGLNFQLGSASHICWYSLTIDYELYDQLIRRIWRMGNESTSIINHILCMENTVDHKGLEIIEGKKFRQDAFLEAVESEILHDDEYAEINAAKVAASLAKKEKTAMPRLKKLGRKSEVEAEAEEEVEEEAEDEAEEEEDEDEETSAGGFARPSGKRQHKKVKKSLKKRGSRRSDEDEEEEEDEEEPASSKAKRAFSKRTRSQMEGEDVEEEEEDDGEEEEEETPRPSKRRKSRKRSSSKTQEAAPAEVSINYRELASAIIDEFFSRLAGGR